MFTTAVARHILRGQCNVSKNLQYIRYYSTEIDFDKIVKNNKVVVFMKGNPKAPRCGFSNAVVQILRMHGVTYDAHDVLQNEDMREGVKKFSSWPTIPQVFINGEFVGGCDIILQMHQNGELVQELKKVGITSALLDKAVKENESKSEKRVEK